MADRNYKQVALDVLVAIATNDDGYESERMAAAKTILEFGVYPEADDVVREPVYEADGTVA